MPREAIQAWVEALHRGEAQLPEDRLVLTCDIVTKEPVDCISRAGEGYLYDTRIGVLRFATVIRARGLQEPVVPRPRSRKGLCRRWSKR